MKPLTITPDFDLINLQLCYECVFILILWSGLQLGVFLSYLGDFLGSLSFYEIFISTTIYQENSEKSPKSHPAINLIPSATNN
jgi:hypothetical protein